MKVVCQACSIQDRWAFFFVKMGRMVCFKQLHHTRLRFTIPPGRFMLLVARLGCGWGLRVVQIIIEKEEPTNSKQ